MDGTFGEKAIEEKRKVLGYSGQRNIRIAALSEALFACLTGMRLYNGRKI